ncbi:glycosyl hydrolase 53 family protein [Winogradskyella psychrotolerans]|nr:glycosyl hydrolase 53 family protein [Winogradskyella psychrotolerans]
MAEIKFLKYWLSSSIVILTSCSDNNNNNSITDDDIPENELFYKGMDLSFQSELKNYVIDYKDANGNSVELLGFVKSKRTNLISSNHIILEFASTPQGQKAYMEWLIFTIKAIPNKKEIGFCYWAPDWVAFNGNENTSTNGTSWENQCMFDFNLKALSILDVFNNN